MPDNLTIGILLSMFAVGGGLFAWLIRGGPLKPILEGLRGDLQKLTGVVGALGLDLAGHTPRLDALVSRVDQSEKLGLSQDRLLHDIDLRLATLIANSTKEN